MTYYVIVRDDGRFLTEGSLLTAYNHLFTENGDNARRFKNKELAHVAIGLLPGSNDLYFIEPRQYLSVD